MNTLRCYDSFGNSISQFTQWDINQTITVKDLDLEGTPIFHFGNKNYNYTFGVTPTTNEDGTITAKVPNSLLQEAVMLDVYLYITNNEIGTTIYKARIGVREKAKPLDYEYTDNVDVIYIEDVIEEIKELENKLQSSVNDVITKLDNGDFNGKDAVTDSKLDANSNNAISNSAVSIAINEIVEQLKNGIIADDNTENKKVTDTQICITDNIGKNIKSIVCDSYPKQITVVRNNMATCDDFFRDMTNKQARVIFTNHLDTKYNQGGVNWVYLDGLKTGSYIMSAKSNTEGQTVTKMVRTSVGAVVAPQSTLDEYTFTNNQERTGQIQVRFDPTAVGITATQVYMCKAEDKQIITVNSAEDVFENILGDKNTYLFAEDGSEITVVYETEKKDKPLKGKYLSVLGDSISSYEGYAKNADHIIYPNYDVFKPNRMYWGSFCEMTGAEPLVIDGVGSSTITNIRDSLGGDETFVGMYHDNRAKQLGKDGIVPDIIVVEGGTNDMALNVNLGTYDGSTDFPTSANKFREAYAIMLDKIRTEYPKAEIYCGTIMARPNATDYTIKQYNDAIREIAELMGAKIIDFAKCLNVKNYQQFISSDNIHPEYDGHIRMCDEMIKAVL